MRTRLLSSAMAIAQRLRRLLKAAAWQGRTLTGVQLAVLGCTIVLGYLQVWTQVEHRSSKQTGVAQGHRQPASWA